MIKIDMPDAPKILIDNKGIWTNSLLDAVKKYGSYSNIPQDEKSKLLVHYRHSDIQKLLFDSSYQKCAFCECKPGECGNIEVEHFAPKSLYPELAFEWSNLLPSCRKCNEAKLNYDTKNNPIVNPAKENPEEFFTYNLLRITPISGCGEEKKAQTTIDVCNLNCERLYNARAILMKSITEYMDELTDKLSWIFEADTDQKKKYRITRLKNSLAVIEGLMEADAPYSAYSKWLIEQSDSYKKAKSLISNQ